MANNNETTRRNGQWHDFRVRFCRNRYAVAGLIILCIIILCAIFAGTMFNYENVVIKQDFSSLFEKPSSEHPFGTDAYGRDYLARVVYGARISLGISFASVVVALVIGTIIGCLSAYYGGVLDMVVMRLLDILMALPSILIAILLVSVVGTSLVSIGVAIAIGLLPTFTRVARGAALTVCGRDYIEAARSLGASSMFIMFKHIIPNCFAALLVQVSLSLASAIMSVSALSYLGLGVQTPLPEWGSMLSQARSYLANYPYLAIFPGAAIMLTVLAINLLSDGLRDATDPKLR